MRERERDKEREIKRERERDKEREIERERERQREKEKCRRILLFSLLVVKNENWQM